jgi:transglutaminase-like putative cysteine protease
MRSTPATSRTSSPSARSAGSDVRYRVTHRTEYRYDAVVSTSFGTAHLLPRELDDQRCAKATVTITPDPAELREHVDYFGNRTLYFAVRHPHRKLVVTSSSEVDVQPRSSDATLLGEQRWELVRDRLTRELTEDAIDARQFVLDSPLVASSDALRAYAEGSFPAGRTVTAAVADLVHRIHTDFDYKPGVTSVTTTLDELLVLREGVCQDFAHLAIGCLRAVGLPARYVSGYLETDPPPGRPRLAGADATHAWVSALLPGAGWADVDPTNDQLVDDRYVTTAWGRDYTDVPPLKGVIFSQGTAHELRVSVDVEAVEAAEQVAPTRG